MTTIETLLERGKRFDSNISELRGKYSGRVFLVGNGPSLNETPLEQLYEQGEYTFAMNNISRIFPKTTWRPSFYFAVSSNLKVKARRKYFIEPSHLNIPCFIERGWQGTYPDRPNVYWIYCPYMKGKEEDGNPALWSQDCGIITGRHATSMYSVMQIAVYLGFTELYLIGCDLGYKGFNRGEPDPSHFDTNYWEGLLPFTDEGAERENNNMLRAHTYAKGMLDHLGITVKNATVGGELEVYERIDIDELLS